MFHVSCFRALSKAEVLVAGWVAGFRALSEAEVLVS